MKLVILFFIILTTLSLAQNSNCLSYEPKIENINGLIERITFPGPPNYESIKEGDKPEVYWILKLKKPICVRGTKDDEINVTESRIKEVQLVLDTNQYKKYRKLIGENVLVKGKIFHAFTGHHKTKILINVQDIIYKK